MHPAEPGAGARRSLGKPDKCRSAVHWRPNRLAWAMVLGGCALLALAAAAHAGCCRVIRVDTLTPTGTVRICEPDTNAGCGPVLFEGTLAVGDSQNVCVTGQTVVYQEYDTTLNAYEPPVRAVCDGADVEL
jgi:hypothetical protein